MSEQIITCMTCGDTTCTNMAEVNECDVCTLNEHGTRFEFCDNCKKAVEIKKN